MKDIWTKKNAELKGEWQEAHAANDELGATLDKRAKGLELQADEYNKLGAALDKRTHAVELLEVQVEQKMQRARGIVLESEWECEEKDEKIKELQAQVDVYEKRAKPKKRKRQN